MSTSQDQEARGQQFKKKYISNAQQGDMDASMKSQQVSCRIDSKNTVPLNLKY